MTMTKSTKRTVVLAVVAVVVVVGAVALWAFAPWKAFTNKTVNEALPSTSATAPSPGQTDIPQPSGPITLAAGTFRSYEHATTGTAKIVQVAQGNNVLRLDNFKTSDGPDVRVWLSVKSADAADGAQNAKYLDLGIMKGNIGNQNYVIPVGTQFTEYRSVIIWCKRFRTPFGAAELIPQEVRILN